MPHPENHTSICCYMFNFCLSCTKSSCLKAFNSSRDVLQLLQLSDMKIWTILFLLHIFVFSCRMQRTGYLRLTGYLQFFFKENVMYPVLIYRDPISLILRTRFSILGTRIGSLKPGLT